MSGEDVEGTAALVRGDAEGKEDVGGESKLRKE